jgi:hypothetical protein
MKEGHTMTDEELIDALGTDLGLSWDMVFCEDKGAAVRDAAREYLAARSAKEEAGKKLIGHHGSIQKFTRPMVNR